MPPRKTKKVDTVPPPTCPALPKKIEVVLPPKESPSHDATPDEALVKDLRSRLRKSQMRVREMEKVLTTSLITMVHTHPHLSSATSSSASQPMSTSSITAIPPLQHRQQSEEQIAEKAAEIVDAHERIGDVSAIQASKRSLKELEHSLDVIDTKMASIRKKNRDLQQRYGRIEASLNREVWKSKVKGDLPREQYLASLATQQSTKYQQMSQSYSNQMQDLTLKKESIMAQHTSTDTSLQASLQASQSFDRAVASLRSNLHTT